MKKIILAVVAVLAVILMKPIQANGGVIEVYRNHKTTNNRGLSRCKYSLNKKRKINFKKKKACKNDAVKSVVLLGGHDGIKKGTRIRLFDSPKGKKNDDWLEIKVLRDIPAWTRFHLPTLHMSYKGHFLKVKYHKKNGLNGKVSRMEILPPK